MKRLCPYDIALVERLNYVRMNTALARAAGVVQRRREERLGGEQELRAGRSYKTVALAGCADGLVERTVDAVKDWLVCTAPRCVCECAQMDDTRALAAVDVTSADAVCSVLDLTRYPEASAATLRTEMEEAVRLLALAPPTPPQPSVPTGPVLLPSVDLRNMSAQALGDDIAAILPDNAAYSALFVSAGFDGMLLCDADDAELQQLVQDVGIVNAIHRLRVIAQRTVRSRYALQPQNP